MKKVILIVEDEMSLLRVLEQKFKQEGFEVVLAKDGLEGLQKFKEQVPDLMLVDIIMPHLDGITMLGKIRQEPNGKNVPAILLTNLSDAEKAQEGIKHGVYDYLVKAEWKLADVVSKVKEKLSAAE